MITFASIFSIARNTESSVVRVAWLSALHGWSNNSALCHQQIDKTLSSVPLKNQPSPAWHFRSFASSHPSTSPPKQQKGTEKGPIKEDKRPNSSSSTPSDNKKYGKSGGPRVKELEFKMETDQHDLDTKLKKAKKWLLERYFRVEVTMSYRSEGEKKVEKEAALERFKSTIGTLTDMGTSLGRQPEAGTIAHLVNLPTKSSFKVMIHPPPAPPPPPPPARPPSKPTEESNESKTME